MLVGKQWRGRSLGMRRVTGGRGIISPFPDESMRSLSGQKVGMQRLMLTDLLVLGQLPAQEEDWHE